VLLASSKSLQNILPHRLRTTEMESEENKKCKQRELSAFVEIIQVGFVLFFSFNRRQSDLSFDTGEHSILSAPKFEILLLGKVLMDCINSV